PLLSRLFLWRASLFERACTGCMILHAKKCSCRPPPPQCWRGLEPVMQLHEKRYMKRAGEAGIALRASGKVFI
ncbi:hypothetical protein L3219_004218, partial [Serratia marcescens]